MSDNYQALYEQERATNARLQAIIDSLRAQVEALQVEVEI